MFTQSSQPLMRCTGAVLIGGRCRRMGAVGAKQHAVLADGRMMIEHIVETLRSVCAAEIVLLGGPANEPRTLNLEQVRHVPDLRPGLGPLAGIEALLASPIDSQYLICPCDTPRLTPDLLERLLESTAALASVFQVRGAGNIESLPLRIAADALPIVRKHLDADQRSIWRCVRDSQPRVVELNSSDAALLANINTPDELNTLRRQLPAV